MKAIRVTAKTGEQWITDINGTKAEIDAYFLGQWFNIGSVNDHLVQVCKVEHLRPGEAIGYMLSDANEKVKP
jgi:hypothetical protein